VRSSAARVGLATVSILVAAPAGCGNAVTTDVVGMTGVTADAQGRPVVIVAACGAAYDRIAVSDMLDRSTVPATQVNETLLTMTRETPLTGTETVSLTDPLAPWSASKRFEPTEPDGIDVAAFAEGEDRTTTSVMVTRAEYHQVSADVVLVRQGERWTRAEFDARACDRDSWPEVTIS